MRRAVIRLTVVGVAGSVAFAGALELGPRDRALALAAYLAFLCALALVGLATTLGTTLPIARQLLAPNHAHHQEETPRVAQLEWIERQLTGAHDSASTLRVHFRPLVSQIASAALTRKHGVVLERQPERAREIVGEHVWSLIGSELPKPEDRFAPGLGIEELRRLIEELEAI